MKKALFGLMALVVAALVFVACDDDDDDAAVYYVRYTVGAHAGDDFFVSYNDRDGEPHILQQVSGDGKVEIVVGPVRAGFKAEVAASVNGGAAPEYAQIDVSCGGRPFVQKLHVPHGTFIYYTVSSADR